ncbi:hypothetical protein [Rubrimonas cliftonensis]|uniref:VPLPA-CTERM protein sorting domain-containing protein n=1 Tax=Rubrimonas cliftonensis TaxID=89524 RepID=A0A1H4AF46_9RHOB|nr:hypothetical protein [Rubrimonas cliftonensis]SEA34391.1 hypothetical protein SAMN05444370_104194 [Rubrimonas cliftonensis]
MRLSVSFAAAAVAAALLAAPASAVSISISSFSPTGYAGALGGFASVAASEDFEGFARGEQGGPLATSVGAFETLGGTGSGSTVTGTRGNTGTGLYLRDRSTHGRSNTTTGGSNFLDSNDTFGMSWTISGLGLFDSVLFNLSDVGDTGGNLSISAGGTVLDTILKGRSGSLIDTVLISFGGFVGDATITLEKSKLNDGFAIDDVIVGSSVAAVPLPPAALALVAGLGAIFFAARRRRADA